MKKFIIPNNSFMSYWHLYWKYQYPLCQGSQNQQNYSVETSPQNASLIVMGASYINVPNNAKVVTQIDRVIKDTASNINDNTPPGQSPSSPSQLVPYMEGARVSQLMKYAHVPGYPNYGVPIKNINGNSYRNQ